MSQQVIGLLGRAGAGKDTSAQALIAAGWERIAFADPLYREVGQAFDVTVEFLGNRSTKKTPLPELALYKCKDQVFVAVALAHAGMQLGVTHARKIRAFLMKDRSPRQVMQWWGTEYKRKIVSQDYWVNLCRQAILAKPDKNFVITDIRVPDEAIMVTDEFAGTLVRVIRPSLEALIDPNDESVQHSTETLMLNYTVHLELINEDGPDGAAKLGQGMLDWAKAAVAKLVQEASAEATVAA